MALCVTPVASGCRSLHPAGSSLCLPATARAASPQRDVLQKAPPRPAGAKELESLSTCTWNGHRAPEILTVSSCADTATYCLSRHNPGCARKAEKKTHAARNTKRPPSRERLPSKLQRRNKCHRTLTLKPEASGTCPKKQRRATKSHEITCILRCWGPADS